MPVRRISLVLRVIQRVTLAAGLSLLLWPSFVMAESLWVQWVGGWQLKVASRELPETIVAPKVGASPSRSSVRRGSVLGQFEVPRLGLSYVLLEGTDNRTLDRSVGHVEGTGLPGSAGNVGIAGHRDRHFRKLEWIHRDDQIVLTSPGGARYAYRVEWSRLFKPGDIQVLDE